MKVIFFGHFSRRAKEKRLKKDAGRARWGQYFRNGNGSGTNGGAIGKDGSRTAKLEDMKDDLIIGFSSGKLCKSPTIRWKEIIRLTS